MDSLEPSQKKARPDDDLNANGADADSSLPSGEVDCRRYHTSEGCPLGDACHFRQFSLTGNGTGPAVSVGLPSRTKPCLKFFSTCGCPYGEGCHFSHYVPGGLSALALAGFGGLGGGRLFGGLSLASFANPSLFAHDPGPNLGGYKTRLCNRHGTVMGCRFGDKCHFAHGESELQKSDGGISLGELNKISFDYSKDSSTSGSQVLPGMGVQQLEPTPPGMTGEAPYGTTNIAKINIDGNLAGAIIGRGGVNAKHICRITGAKLSIREHESDPKLRNVEIEGSPDQIRLASQMVRELLMHKDPQPPKPTVFSSHSYKTKMCENFAKGTCTFGDQCHFAHGENELCEPSIQA
eukprot:c22553_g1_i1 orf=298-1347(+)